MTRVAPLAAVLGTVCACAGDTQNGTSAKSARTLTLAAYTTPREVYGQKIIPAFQMMWKEKTGEDVKFEQSYQGSGAQSRAVKGGFEADVVALALDPDVETLVDAGLITRDWRAGAVKGMVTRSVVVIGVRQGNPKHIASWSDLSRKGVEVLTPNPRTSGGAMWNVSALYGAALRAAPDTSVADALLRKVIGNVKIMDKGARESMITFESGVGDAIITYENEVIAARRAGKSLDVVIPSSTLLIENPAAVVDAYADRHGTRDLADAFVQFLTTAEVQMMFAEYGYRPVVDGAAAMKFDAVRDLFTIRDMGGWPMVQTTLFGTGGAFERASVGGQATVK